MNKSITGVLKMFLADMKLSVLIFWGIMFAVYAILVYAVLQFGDGEVISGNVSPLYIYMLILGIVGLKETFPYALGMNVRRKDYFFGILLSGLVVAAAFSVVQTLLALLERAAFGQLGDVVQFFRIPAFADIGAAGAWLTQFLILTFMFALGFLIALIFNRFGSTGLYALAGIALIAIILTHLMDGWSRVFAWLFGLDSLLSLALWLTPVALLLLAASYGLIRRATA